MALPKIDLPVYKHYLKGIKKEVSFRPYTNKEQKILLLAKQSEDKKQIIDAIEQLLNLCIQDKDIDIKKLPSFDVEDIFLRIRSKSVGEVITPQYKYTYTDEDGKQKEEIVQVNINFDDVEVKVNKNHSNIIKLDDTYSLKMTYPTYDLMGKVEVSEDPEKEIILGCIECVFDENEVYTLNNSTQEEIDAFYDSFTNDIMKEIKDFFDSIPKLEHSVTVTKKDGEKETITYRGLESFFI